MISEGNGFTKKLCAGQDHSAGSQADLESLIRKAQEGSREAFDLIALRFKDLLETKIRSDLGALLRGKIEVEDLLQVTLLEAYEAIGQFRGRTEVSFRSWLLTIARHVVLEQGRRLKAKKALQAREVPFSKNVAPDGSGPGDLGGLLAASDPSPSKILRREERFERLKAALGSLSQDYRQVLLLSFVDGLPVREIARRMERSPKATSLLLWRALKALKNDFGNTESVRLPHRSLEE